MKTTIHPLKLIFRTYCKVCEEWYQFKIDMHDFLNAESAAEDTMRELGWVNGICPYHLDQIEAKIQPRLDGICPYHPNKKQWKHTT